MADFDSIAAERRFRERKVRIDDFYKYLDVTYRSISKVPTNEAEEEDQRQYIINELDTLEQRMDRFRNELRSS